MRKNIPTALTLLSLGLLAASALPTRAQSPTISGSQEKFAGDCHGGDAVVSGNRNQVTLKGFCRDLTIRGNQNQILVEMTSQGRILVPGNGNKVDYRIPAGGLPPERTILGNDNVVSQVAGDSEPPRSGVVEPRGTGRIRQ